MHTCTCIKLFRSIEHGFVNSSICCSSSNLHLEVPRHIGRDLWSYSKVRLLQMNLFLLACIFLMYLCNATYSGMFPLTFYLATVLLTAVHPVSSVACAAVHNWRTIYPYQYIWSATGFFAIIIIGHKAQCSRYSRETSNALLTLEKVRNGYVTVRNGYRQWICCG